MAIRVELIRENRVVLQTYSDPLDNAQFHDLKNKMEHEILPAGEDKLHIIADFRAVKNLPGTILTTGSSMLTNAHPNTGVIICVTQNSFVQAMGRILIKLAPKQGFKIVPSLDEAYIEVDRLLGQKT